MYRHNTEYLSKKDKQIFYLICHQYPHSCHIINGKTQVKFLEDNALREKIIIYLSELSSKPEEEINEMYINVRQQQEIELKRQHEERERSKEANYFFNQSNSNATEDELEYWAKMPYWTMEEALTLMFGKHPDVVNWDNIKHYKDKSAFAKDYSKIRELILRAISTNELKCSKDLVGLSPVKAKPADILTWVKKKGTQVNGTLEKMVLEQNKEATDYKALYRENEELKNRIRDLERNSPQKTASALTKELESKNKIIIAMAKKHYRFDPKASKSTATGNIRQAIEDCGLSLDEETIRKHLKESAELLPQNPEESIY